MNAIAPTVRLVEAPLQRRTALAWLGEVATLAFGLATLVVVLAVVAAIPVVQLLTLGYLLEAEGRIARTGAIRGALPGLTLLGRVGSATIGLLAVFAPWLILRDFWLDARLIDPASTITRQLGGWVVAVGVLALGHAVLALARGRGRLGPFFRPVKNVGWAIGCVRRGEGPGTAIAEAIETVRALELPRVFLLGVKGFVAAVLWVAIPTALLALDRRAPGLAFLGGVMLALAVVPLPLLQAHVAAEGRLGAGFELRTVWRRWRAAPITAFLALFLALGLALPLYLLKLEHIPRDANQLVAIVFIVTILPTKLVAGLAYWRGRAAAEGKRAHFLLRAPSALLALPAAGFYVLVLFGTRYITWDGPVGLFEQHAFLVPVAFYR